MPRNGSGSYSPPTNSWSPAINGVPATAADWQTILNDISSALTQSLSRDGQTPLTGNLPAGGNKLTGLADGTAAGDSLRFEQLFSQGQPADLASAATTDIGAQLTTLLNITGTTTITSFGANYNGPRFLHFTDVLTLTHNATTLVLPGNANIVTAAGDSAIVVPNSTPANGWRVVAYQRADGGAIPGTFRKANPDVVAFTKTGNSTATTSSTLYVEVNGQLLTIVNGAGITMPTLVAGTDYAIWCRPDGVLEATSNHTTPPVANSRKIGGFHYAPGGNAAAQAGGNTTAQINEFSFWDLKWRPACPDPRGMTLVAGGFWVDIYLTGVDAITNGSSRYNVAIADGSSPPKVPTIFGGNGTTTYGSYTWFEAQEFATAFGKRTLTQQEFMAAAYGTTEATSSGGTDVPTTGVSGTGATSAWNVFTSRWGVIQAAGCMYVWGRERGGPAAAASWNANTEGRGSEYNAPNASLFGGHWANGANSGARCSVWDNAASFSNNNVGSRFSSDHLQVD